MPYIDAVKWIINHANPQEHSFNDQTQPELVSFHLEVFSRGYSVNPQQQLLNKKFLETSVT